MEVECPTLYPLLLLTTTECRNMILKTLTQPLHRNFMKRQRLNLLLMSVSLQNYLYPRLHNRKKSKYLLNKTLAILETLNSPKHKLMTINSLVSSSLCNNSPNRTTNLIWDNSLCLQNQLCNLRMKTHLLALVSLHNHLI
jgi:hypothetical protein